MMKLTNNNFSPQLWEQLCDRTNDQIWFQLWDRTKNRFSPQHEAQFRSQIWRQINRLKDTK